ncbi:hypothetical protein C8J57DRAFT_1306173 [Mycena rebaudengoi]|nr:hypothetical protein C8J57DRAFT_1306173 [Mycena rebaudengoi]
MFGAATTQLTETSKGEGKNRSRPRGFLTTAESMMPRKSARAAEAQLKAPDITSAPPVIGARDVCGQYAGNTHPISSAHSRIPAQDENRRQPPRAPLIRAAIQLRDEKRETNAARQRRARCRRRRARRGGEGEAAHRWYEGCNSNTARGTRKNSTAGGDQDG